MAQDNVVIGQSPVFLQGTEKAADQLGSQCAPAGGCCDTSRTVTEAGEKMARVVAPVSEQEKVATDEGAAETATEEKTAVTIEEKP